MEVLFPYPEIEPVEVPDKNLIGVYGLPEAASASPPEELVSDALAEPVGSPRLRELTKGKKTAVILCDDNTRTTPGHILLPPILEELRRGGVSPDATRILMALGTHRSMTPDEMIAKVGEQIYREYEVLNHEWERPDTFVDLGHTDSGIPVQVNRIATEADVLVSIGHVIPHIIAGFSAGAKTVQPGVCSEETTGRTHWLSALSHFEHILGVRENPVRKEIDSIGRRAGLSFIVNTVQNSQAEILEVYAGDMVSAHVRACAAAKQVCSVAIPRLADIVLADACPADIDMWQAVKGLAAAGLAVRPGGVVILVAPCPEGASGQHGLEDVGYRPVEEIRGMVSAGELRDLALGAHIVHGSQIAVERAQTIMVSPGLGPDVAERLHVLWAASAGEALDRAWSLVGRDAKVSVLQRAAELLPSIGH